MAFDESLAVRIRAALAGQKNVTEKKMFGGVCFLFNGNMLVGVWKEFLIARLGPDQGDEALTKPYVRRMDITGKPMKGWIMFEPAGVEEVSSVKEWIQRAMKFVGELEKKSEVTKEMAFA